MVGSRIAHKSKEAGAEIVGVGFVRRLTTEAHFAKIIFFTALKFPAWRR